MSDGPVGMVPGNDSGLPIIQKCAAALVGFGISNETVVSSTHCHPEKTARYAGEGESAHGACPVAGDDQ